MKQSLYQSRGSSDSQIVLRDKISTQFCVIIYIQVVCDTQNSILYYYNSINKCYLINVYNVFFLFMNDFIVYEFMTH